MLQLQNQECGSVVDKTLAWHSQGPRLNSQDYKRKKVEGGEQRGGERRSKEKSKKEKWKKNIVSYYIDKQAFLSANNRFKQEVNRHFKMRFQL